MEAFRQRVEAERTRRIAGGFPDLAARQGEDHVGAGNAKALGVGDLAHDLGVRGGEGGFGGGRAPGLKGDREKERASERGAERNAARGEAEHGGDLSREDYATPASSEGLARRLKEATGGAKVPADPGGAVAIRTDIERRRNRRRPAIFPGGFCHAKHHGRLDVSPVAE